MRWCYYGPANHRHSNALSLSACTLNCLWVHLSSAWSDLLLWDHTRSRSLQGYTCLKRSHLCLENKKHFYLCAQLWCTALARWSKSEQSPLVKYWLEFEKAGTKHLFKMTTIAAVRSAPSHECRFNKNSELNPFIIQSHGHLDTTQDQLSFGSYKTMCGHT